MIAAASVPANSPVVVMPNAAPGANLITETSMPTVTDIVMLKKRIPISDTIIILSPKIRNGTAPRMLINAVFRAPIRSASNPPAALPAPRAVKSSIVWNVVLFHEVGMP